MLTQADKEWFEQMFDRSFDKKFDQKFDQKFDAAFDRRFDQKFDVAFDRKFDQKFGPAFDQKFDEKFKTTFIPFMETIFGQLHREIVEMREDIATTHEFLRIHSVKIEHCESRIGTLEKNAHSSH